jgi:N4-gp56 family major capsid protein
MTMQYKDPIGGTPSTMGNQLELYKVRRQALIEMQKEQYFGQMADVEMMPKHFGKTIKGYHYLPLLDDANINDQGIDAAGATTQQKVTIEIVPGDVFEASNGLTNYFAIGEGADAATALTAAKAHAVDIFTTLGVFDTDYATTKAALEAEDPAWTITEHPSVPVSGNLYGSSKDIGTIVGKLPSLTENGGRVNRVGFSRREVEGKLYKYGFFDEYTKESMDFDTDMQLEMHINREMLRGANEMTEDLLQIDLLQAAGVVRYGGDATSTAEITGEGTVSVASYEDLMKLSISLDNNHCPKQTTMITGSTATDTKVIAGARYMFVGSEILPTLERMKDLHNERAFIRVEHYARAGTVARGEEGSIGKFRIIVVPEMMHWAGAGATATVANEGYRTTDGKYDVFPMLVVGEKSFTNIGFQTNGKAFKYKIKHVKPESDISYSADDPFGEKGFMSIKWYYGFMALRPERIALVKVVAEI